MRTCHVPRHACHVTRTPCGTRSPAFAVWCVVVALLVMTGVVGCSSTSSSKETTEDDTFHLAAFEDFDAEKHPDVVPPPAEITEHEIPDPLAAPRIEGIEGIKGIKGPPRRVRGYRVQLFASREKRVADAELQRALDWWEHNRSDENMVQPPIYVEYEQPYYKVRLGDYRGREAAAQDAETVSGTFRGAFVVPAIVNVE